MASPQIQQGELAYWLQVLAEHQQGRGLETEVPEKFIEALITLRCISRSEDGQLVLTEKGKLALHMEGPGAIHRQ
ncbi:hypothetical protein CEG14_17280 [Bordetella genomosp. 1]|uniref:Uncharacterized protein n=1 Tax=Bordetella genomosp. 1 TaxID=1395607 RepID=A0A261S6B4_9BORD|nr:hypothetical protein [Bordetella genomosp. 1]MDQ8034944.1 hypothetical protein [Bordetella sp.]OZI32661.1 hypothetical protein CEG14_17280 [Bordetella genomosp. 1]OZI65980.1 hypothetical protein CAL27_13420 [Bordetella genomosp. 1]